MHKTMNTEPRKSSKNKASNKSKVSTEVNQRYYQMDLFSDSTYELQRDMSDMEIQAELKGMFIPVVEYKSYED